MAKAKKPTSGLGVKNEPRKWALFTVIGATLASLFTVGHLLGGISGYLDFYKHATEYFSPHTVSKSETSSSAPALRRLSIVVLPFANISGDHEKDYFADGVTEDVTSDLSRISGLFVIAHDTALFYRGKTLDVRQIGSELGVRYVLEGSVRRFADVVRVDAQLISTETGANLWSDRFNGEVAKLSALQDLITARLARSLDIELTYIESNRSKLESPDKPNAVDLTMRGWALLRGHIDRERYKTAMLLFEKSLQIDPNYTEALVGYGRALSKAVTLRWITEGEDEVLRRAEDALNRALASAPNNAMAHLGKAEYFRARYNAEAASAELETALAINPNLAEASAYLAITRTLTGRSREALAPVDAALALSPRDPQLRNFYAWKCHVYSHLAQYDAVIEWCRKSVAMTPNLFPLEDLISAYGWKGLQDEARPLIAELYKIIPNYSIKERVKRNAPWINPITKAEIERITEGLRKAEIREE